MMIGHSALPSTQSFGHPDFFRTMSDVQRQNESLYIIKLQGYCDVLKGTLLEADLARSKMFTPTSCRVATVREKYLENEIFSRAGKSQGVLWMVREI